MHDKTDADKINGEGTCISVTPVKSLILGESSL